MRTVGWFSCYYYPAPAATLPVSPFSVFRLCGRMILPHQLLIHQFYSLPPLRFRCNRTLADLLLTLPDTFLRVVCFLPHACTMHTTPFRIGLLAGSGSSFQCVPSGRFTRTGAAWLLPAHDNTSTVIHACSEAHAKKKGVRIPFLLPALPLTTPPRSITHGVVVVVQGTLFYQPMIIHCNRSLF